MNLLLTQQEIQLPFRPHLFDALERSWYSFFLNHKITVCPNIPDYFTTINQFDALVITGGGDSMARHLNENKLYSLFEQANIPIIGICHGAFAINDIAGGVNGRCKGHHETMHQISMDDQLVEVNSFHSQCIDKLAPNFRPLASDMDGRPESFVHLFKPIWGVVWHPERMQTPILPECLEKLLN
jgi:GMP synthase-like glutamine amidotransferase